MDLAVDEQGLWVLWGSTGNSNRLTAAKIDVKINRIVRTWNLNTGIRMQLGHTNTCAITLRNLSQNSTTKRCHLGAGNVCVTSKCSA